MVSINAKNPIWQEILDFAKNALVKHRQSWYIDDLEMSGYSSPDSKPIWIRDNSDMLRSARFLDDQPLQIIEHFANSQQQNGQIMDYISVGEDKENWVKYVRVPVENDVEYRFVKSVHLLSQVSDSAWLNRF